MRPRHPALLWSPCSTGDSVRWCPRRSLAHMDLKYRNNRHDERLCSAGLAESMNPCHSSRMGVLVHSGQAQTAAGEKLSPRQSQSCQNLPAYREMRLPRSRLSSCWAVRAQQPLQPVWSQGPLWRICGKVANGSAQRPERAAKAAHCASGDLPHGPPSHSPFPEPVTSRE